jgi:hypothetical protein
MKLEDRLAFLIYRDLDSNDLCSAHSAEEQVVAANEDRRRAVVGGSPAFPRLRYTIIEANSDHAGII